MVVTIPNLFLRDGVNDHQAFGFSELLFLLMKKCLKEMENVFIFF